MIKSTQDKLILFMSLLILFMIGGLFLFRYSEQNKINTLLLDKQRESAVLTDRILELESAAIRNMLQDFTFWDDLVAFVRTADPAWPEMNIIHPMETFSIDFAWVYGKDLSLVYSYNRFKHPHFKTLPLSSQEMASVVSPGASIHFFFMSDLGLMEVFGASIHPTHDPNRLTPPEGYFFYARLWDEDFLKKLSESTAAEIILLPTEPARPAKPRIDNVNFVIENVKSLNGWNGSPVAHLIFRTPIEIARTLKSRADKQYSLIILFSIIILEAISYILYLFVFRPLHMITRALERNDSGIIAPLMTAEHEFGQLARTVARFFEQQQKLQNEVEEHKKAVEALRASEEKYRNLVDTMLDGVYKSTHDGRFVEVNEALVKMLGYDSKEELMKIDIPTQLYFQPEDRDSATLQEKLEETAVFRLRKKDGSEIWVEDHGRHILDEQGNIIYHEGILRDISDRLRAQEALRKSEEWMRILIEGTSDFFLYTQDAVGRVSYISPSVEKITGHTVDEWMGQTHWFTTDSDINRIARERTNKHLRGEDTNEPMLVEMEHADGSIIYLELFEHPIFRNGRVIGIQGLAHDITARKRAEQEQWARFQRLRKQHETMIRLAADRTTIQENLQEALQRITEAAAEALDAARCSIWRLEEEDSWLVCKDLYLSHQKRHAISVEPLKTEAFPIYLQALRSSRVVPLHDALNDPYSRELIEGYLKPNGITAMLDAPIRMAGKLTGVVCFESVNGPRVWAEDEINFAAQISDQVAQAFLDDERHRAEKALRESLDKITVLLKEVHHRVKNNLQIMSSLLNLQAVHTKNAEVLEALREAGNRIRSMALLHETLYRSGNLAFVDSRDYVEIVCGVILRTFTNQQNGGANIRLERHIAPISLDIDQAVSCGLIINELVSNAFKHAFPEKRVGTIKVEMNRLENDLVELIVADDGIGLPPSFSLADHDSLGLRLVTMLTEKLKGTLEHLRRPGTAFRVVFKVRSESE